VSEMVIFSIVAGCVLGIYADKVDKII